MDTKKIVNTLGSTVAVSTGVGVARIVDASFPSVKMEDGKEIKGMNPKIKHGLLFGAGVLGVVFLNGKNQTSKIAQDVSIGVAGSSLISLAKEFITEPKGVLKTALGNPESEINFLSGYDDYDLIDDNEDYSEDAIYQSVTPEIIFG
ncbi:hypothetical protein [Tenacibaculum piscium]|uniref:hypothetical protein n=1 Tax=Tenacibaculum piscium TaxID=1458515 RepID=UPI00187B7529|nr:hypothetical protein [Tenacibaculum piscium]MBE7671565.1 hypothetical protein [Tenacibaculum piscium]MBE7690685.1 hypothetical protein [Tenacibaculum piscium]